MGLLIAALVTVGLVLTIFWIAGLAQSAAADRRAAMEQAEEQRKLSNRAEKLNRSGEPLRCLNCNTEFNGPLDDSGCPHCHLSTLVIPASEFEAETKSV
jgi:Zn finger protein HypA/HybF involved in hydrogenase expression